MKKAGNKYGMEPSHPTKKGPGRSQGSNKFREMKSRKLPKNISSGYPDYIGVNGIRGKSGCGR